MNPKVLFDVLQGYNKNVNNLESIQRDINIKVLDFERKTTNILNQVFNSKSCNFNKNTKYTKSVSSVPGLSPSPGLSPGISPSPGLSPSVESNVNMNITISNKAEDTLIKSSLYSNYDGDFVKFYDSFINIKTSCKEALYFGFCMLLNTNFIFLNDSNKLNFMKNLKYHVGVEFIKYKSKYKHLRVDKNDLVDKMINNDFIDNNLYYQYLGDFFNINFIKYNLNTKCPTFFNEYDKLRLNLVIYTDDINIICHKNCNNLSIVEGDIMMKELNIKKPTDKKLLKLSLSELQNIAGEKNINIKTNGKNGIKNKTKIQLIDEITL